MTRFGLLSNTVHIRFLKIRSLAYELKIKSHLKLSPFFQHSPKIPPFVSSNNEQRKTLIFYSPRFLEHNTTSMLELNWLNLNNFFFESRICIWWNSKNSKGRCPHLGIPCWKLFLDHSYGDVPPLLPGKVGEALELVHMRVPARRHAGQVEPSV